jgi:hypothetical protein
MRCLALFVVATLLGGLPGARAAEPGETIYTNKMHFRIPFRYDPAEMQRLGAREVQLFVSTDEGRAWHLVQRVVPLAGRFEFRAPSDGVYWFCVRTLDGRNALHPADDQIAPGLKVVVDTTRPRLELTLQQVSAGRVELSWRCEDPNLDLSQLAMEYIQTGDAAWSAVRVVPQTSGRTAWSIPRGGQVAVRGSIRDLASNETQAQNQIEIRQDATFPAGTWTPPPAETAPPRIPDLNQPIAGPAGPAAPEAPIAQGGLPRAESDISPASRLISQDVAGRPPILREAPPAPAAEPVPVPVVEEPPQPAQLLVNARSFQIEYAVDGLGPSGVGAVELFITENNGRKWFKYGDDADLTSPCDVQVPGEGTYGFAIRVQSGVGVGNPPPRAGDMPEMIVVVDTAPPAVEMMPVRQGQGAESRRVEIGWRIQDAHPAERPVALSYAADRQGEWQSISDWQADTGRQVWTAGAEVPPSVYLRVTARDAAGNVGTAETPAPIVFDQSRPTVRIMNVQPR